MLWKDEYLNFNDDFLTNVAFKCWMELCEVCCCGGAVVEENEKIFYTHKNHWLLFLIVVYLTRKRLTTIAVINKI